jgi:hypothetical protein
MKTKRVWDYGINVHRFRWELNIGFYPPEEDDYYCSSYSFTFRLCFFTFGLYTYLEPSDV